MPLPSSSMPFPADRVQLASEVGTAYDHLLGTTYYESYRAGAATGPVKPNFDERISMGPRTLMLVKSTGEEFAKQGGVTGGVSLLAKPTLGSAGSLPLDTKFGVLMITDGIGNITGHSTEETDQFVYPTHEGICGSTINAGDYLYVVVQGPCNCASNADLVLGDRVHTDDGGTTLAAGVAKDVTTGITTWSLGYCMFSTDVSEASSLGMVVPIFIDVHKAVAIA
jgi:hypothetical protein